MKYENLYELIKNDVQASEYYLTLPDYVKDQIASRGSNVNSLESLQDYAENLLRGDD
ncbi:MAG: hypothetical protein LBL34_06815 [Clostridiales bacterium]|jgi:hypothetical protein|nr:hypothetical protein [Clostridiales bacterium]